MCILGAILYILGANIYM